MANVFYNRSASFNPDELADGDAIEAEFDSVSRGFDTIEDLVDLNKAGYPSQTFHVAPATETTHAVQKAQMETALSFKLDAVIYNASNINGGTLAKERLPASIDASTSGNAATASKVSGTAPDGGTADLVSGAMADSDFFRIRVGGGADAGWTEIATADNGNEPIYVRQYSGLFASVVRTAALLDGNGNTVFPGYVYGGNGVLRETAVLTGVIDNGGTLPIPKGFTEDQCAFFVSPRDTNSGVHYWHLSDSASWAEHYRIICYPEGRVARGYTKIYNDVYDVYEYRGFNMSYLVIGVK